MVALLLPFCLNLWRNLKLLLVAILWWQVSLGSNEETRLEYLTEWKSRFQESEIFSAYSVHMVNDGEVERKGYP